MDQNAIPGRQGGIQGLRAAACLLVLFQHSVFFATYAKGLDYHPYLAVNFGRAGVSLFFVISGFVMASCMREGGMFIVNRAARIFPPFWIAIALSYFLLLHAQTGWHFDWPSVFLLPTVPLNNTYEIPYWTLCYEMAFYVVLYLMALARLSQRSVIAICLLWLVAIVVFDAYHSFGFVDENIPFAVIAQPGRLILLTPYPIFFIVGLLGALAMPNAKKYVSTEQLLFVAAVLWGIGNSMPHVSTAPMFLIESVAFCCALLAIRNANFPKFVTTLGDVSYGVYLIHSAIIFGLATALKPHADHLRLSVVWLILLAAGAGGGLIFGYAEYWLHRRLIKPLLRSRGLSRSIAAGQS